MPKTLLVCSNDNVASIGASTTRYGIVAVGGLGWVASELLMQRTFRSAGVISNLYIRVKSNDRGASTYRLRINAANGNQVVSIGASTTGEFEDASNTDTITAGDEVNCSIVTGAGGTSFIAQLRSVVFNATSNTVVSSLGGSQNYASASQTSYLAIVGSSNLAVTNEALVQLKINTAGTLKNMFLYIDSNARTTTTTFSSRIATADGNQTISVANSTTGIFEDTVNTDTVAAGNLVSTKVVTGTGTETLSLITCGYEFETTNSKFYSGGHRSITLNANTTNWFSIGCTFTTIETSTEVNTSTEAQMSFDVTNLWCYISANTVTAASTLSIRKNQAVGSNSVSITASTTGAFEDTTNTDSFIATDEINCQFVTGATGTSLTLRTYGMLLTNTDATGGLSIPVAMKHYRDLRV